MQFNGFEVTPCGNAILTVSNGILTVSGISNSGLDGVLINVAGNSNYTVNFGQLPSIKANNGVLKCSLLSKNAFGQVTPSWEIFKWYDSVSDKIITGYNGTFLPSSYNIFGKLAGATVFAATYSKTTTTVTKTYDANGNFTGCTHTVTTDPVPFDIEINGTTYTVDEYGLKFDSTVPTSLIGLPSIETSPLAEMITGTNLSSFEILSIV